MCHQGKCQHSDEGKLHLTAMTKIVLMSSCIPFEGASWVPSGQQAIFGESLPRPVYFLREDTNEIHTSCLYLYIYNIKLYFLLSQNYSL